MFCFRINEKIERFKYNYVILRNMVVVARVSKGSKMDQIYLPKNRIGLEIGGYVEIKPLGDFESGIGDRKLHYFGIKYIGPIKLEIINRIISLLEGKINKGNIIFTGSFLDKGFEFRDLDVLVISDNKLDVKRLEDVIGEKIGVKIHIIFISNKSLIEGLSNDPLYQIMLSKCIAKKKFIYKINKNINYKTLDLHLLKSKDLIDNFDILNGIEKYYLVRNMMAIYLFLRKDKVGKEELDKEIKDFFGLRDINEIKFNMLDKEKFLRRYKEIYNKTFNEIMRGIKHGAK